MPLRIFRIVPKWPRHKILAAARRAYTLRHQMPPIRQQHSPTQRRFWIRLRQYRSAIRNIAATPALRCARVMVPDCFGAIGIYPCRRRGMHPHKARRHQQRHDDGQYQLPRDQLAYTSGPTTGRFPPRLLRGTSYAASSISGRAQTTAALVRKVNPSSRDVRIGVGRPRKVARITRRGTNLEGIQVILFTVRRVAAHYSLVSRAAHALIASPWSRRIALLAREAEHQQPACSSPLRKPQGYSDSPARRGQASDVTMDLIDGTYRSSVADKRR